MILKKLLIIFLSMVLMLFGCEKKSEELSENENVGENREITVWSWDETFNIKAAKMAAEIYEKENPGVHVNIVTMEREEVLSEIKNMLSTKVYSRLPDIIMLEDYDVQSVLASYENEFVDLTDYIDYTRFADYKNKLCSRNERMYGIPFDSGTAALFYRIDILNKAGYTEDDMQNLTWDRFIKIGQNVYQKTGIPMLTLDPTDLPLVRIIMQSNGVWYVNEDGCTPNIQGNTVLEEALKIHKKMLETNVGMSVNGWNEFISAFQNGEVASVISGAWIISSIKATDAQEGLWRVTTIPVVSGETGAVAASNVGGSAWYVLKKSQNSELATDFIASMFGENDDFIDKLIGEIGIIPVVNNLQTYSNYENQDEFFGGQKITKILTSLTNCIPAVNYGSKTYEIENILETEYQNSLYDDDFEKCLERVQIKAEAVAREE